MDYSYPSVGNGFLAEHISLIATSYRQLLGKPLVDPVLNDKTAAARLFNAPFVLLSHNTAADPIFNYANKKALELFELEWQELIALPSRLSAEPVDQEQRRKLLAQVTDNGFIDHYQGVRISKTGKRFKINNAVVWNLYDRNEIYKGQAACFNEWLFL